MGEGNGYQSGFALFAFITFWIAWVAFAVSYGPLGIFFGWMPALPIALFVGAIWPLIMLGVLAVACIAIFANRH